MKLLFIWKNIMLGTGLAMDAFSVSLANGLAEPKMKKKRMCGIALLFALFQAAMPLLGWCFVHTFVQHFRAFEKWIPWIALVLLLFIGGKMLLDGIAPKEKEQKACQCVQTGLSALFLQGVATSIDALSVGFTIAEYDLKKALVAVSIIAAVTFVICLGGVAIGKKFGVKLSEKAAILGGSILILIGLEIFLASFF